MMLIFIFFLLCILGFIALITAGSIDDGSGAALGLVVVGSMFIIAAMAIKGTIDYKDGQVDAINGKIKYHLVKKPDQTMAWERINEEKH